MIFLTLSLKSLIFLWKIIDFLKIIVQIFDLPLKNHSFCKDRRANLWFSFEKQINFSPGCVIQICVSDKLQTPPNDPLDTFGSESAFASKGFVLRMSLSEHPPFSRNWGFQIWDFREPNRSQEVSLTRGQGSGLTEPTIFILGGQSNMVLLDFWSSPQRRA